jgi:hypothetical protein
MDNIKKFKDFLNGKKIHKKIIKETLEQNNKVFIASEVKKGFTSGEGVIDWELEVNVKDWIKLDDEDIDYIASQIESGETEGNDPIDWRLDFGKDRFDIEEEEEMTRYDIAKQLDMDETEFEDSSDLGDLADSVIDSENNEYAYYEAEELFDEFKDSNDISYIYTHTINKDFDYDKEQHLFRKIIKYYPEFKEKYGELDDFGTPEFDMALKNIIKKYMKRYPITEKKETKQYHYLISKNDVVNLKEINKKNCDLDAKKYALYVDNDDLKNREILKILKEKGFLSKIQISKNDFEKYKKHLKVIK